MSFTYFRGVGPRPPPLPLPLYMFICTCACMFTVVIDVINYKSNMPFQLNFALMK